MLVEQIKKLSNLIRKNGIDYLKIHENGKAYMYLQIITPDGKHCDYEVFLKKVRPERLVYGKVVSEHECFPHNEAGGKWLWSYYTYDRAIKKFMELGRRKP
jgi:hypothetical protein